MNIDEVIRKYVAEQMGTYHLLSGKTQELLSSVFSSKGIVSHSITNREKDPEKLREKITRVTKDYDNPLKEITDLAGVRIITYFPSDVDKIVPLIKKEFKVDPKFSVDKRFSSDPAIFGYASIHLVVEFTPERLKLPEYARFNGMMCEIQVRTILQHAWAEIEHNIIYKSTEDIPFQLRRRFASLAGLLEVADREFESLRQDEKGVRERIQSKIRSAKIDIPVDLESISFYLEKYHKEKNLDSDRVSLLNKLIKSMKISTIEEFDKILSQENLGVIDKALKEGDFRCSYNKRENCLLRYFIAIALHSGIAPEEIYHFSGCRITEDILIQLENEGQRS